MRAGADIRHTVEVSEEGQILLDRQTPVDAALLGAREPHLRAHAPLVAHAVIAAHGDRPGGRLDERGDNLRQRRLARAVPAYEAEDFSLGDFERHAAQRFYRRDALAAEIQAHARERDGVSFGEVFG
jgi:hypothetical protein